MIYISKKPTILRSIVYLFLIGQIWVNIGIPCHLLLDGHKEIMELCHSEDAESEEDNKKEKDHKLRMQFSSLINEALISKNSIANKVYFQSLDYPEIVTPPPEIL